MSAAAQHHRGCVLASENGANRKRSRSEGSDRDVDNFETVRLERKEDCKPLNAKVRNASVDLETFDDTDDKSSLSERKSIQPRKFHDTDTKDSSNGKSYNTERAGTTMLPTHNQQKNSDEYCDQKQSHNQQNDCDDDSKSKNSDKHENYDKSRDKSSGCRFSDDDGDFANQAALISSLLQGKDDKDLCAFLAQQELLHMSHMENVPKPSFPKELADFLYSPLCKSIVVLSGAGMSVASGIPDFRSAGTGMYDTLRPELLTATEQERAAIEEDPTLALDRHMFLKNPLPMLETKRAFILGTHERRWKATLAHRFVELLSTKLGKLTRVYTQVSLSVVK